MSSFRSAAMLSLLVVALAASTGCERKVKESAPSPQGEAAADSALSTEEILARANAAYDEKDWQTAEGLYRELTQRLRTESQPWFRLGNIYARTERPEFAVRAYREALIRDPELTKSWYNMGIVQLRQAANSFLQMQTHTEENTAEHARAKAMYEAIIQFIRTGPQSGDSRVQPATAE